MSILLATIFLVAAPPAESAPVAAPPAIGWLWGDRPTPVGPRPYLPREGDLVFMSRSAPLRTAAYLAFRTGHPLHCAILVRGPDGALAVFETGGNDQKTTTLEPVGPRFREHFSTGHRAVLWVRPIIHPLTADESTLLTEFATAELGKPLQPNYRYLRLVIPGRPTPPSHDDQPQWFCSELVVQGMFDAGLLHAHLAAGSLVPADLFYDRRVNLSDRWSRPCEWTAEHHLPAHHPWLAPTIGSETQSAKTPDAEAGLR